LRETLRALIETEKFDGEIDRLDLESANFPGEEQLVTDEIQRAKEAVAAAREVLEHAELEERRLESSMRDQEELILRLNHQSAQVSSNQAYTALQHELDAADAAKTEFETLALEHMEAIDRGQEALASVEEKRLAFEAAAPDKNHEIDERRKEVEAKRAEVVAVRDETCAVIDARIMKRYRAIRQKKQPAVGVLAGTNCPHCRIGLPRMRVSEILRLEDVFECSNCKRLLAPEKIYDERS
jgi:predicted  nucleic acid-binding Zn-ribbon protein